VTKIYEKKTVEHSVVVGATCDWCGKPVDLNPDLWESWDFELSAKYVWHFSSSFSDGWEVEDLCRACAEKLHKLLKENGIKTNEFVGR
jgi:hypothetical protein